MSYKAQKITATKKGKNGNAKEFNLPLLVMIMTMMVKMMMIEDKGCLRWANLVITGREKRFIFWVYKGSTVNCCL